MVAAMLMGQDGLIVLLVIALLFGSSQLPKLARALGSASHEFKKGVDEGHDAAESASEENKQA